MINSGPVCTTDCTVSRLVVLMSDVAPQPTVNGTKSKPAASETGID